MPACVPPSAHGRVGHRIAGLPLLGSPVGALVVGLVVGAAVGAHVWPDEVGLRVARPPQTKPMPLLGSCHECELAGTLHSA